MTKRTAIPLLLLCLVAAGVGVFFGTDWFLSKKDVQKPVEIDPNEQRGVGAEGPPRTTDQRVLRSSTITAAWVKTSSRNDGRRRLRSRYDTGGKTCSS